MHFILGTLSLSGILQALPQCSRALPVVAAVELELPPPERARNEAAATEGAATRFGATATGTRPHSTGASSPTASIKNTARLHLAKGTAARFVAKRTDSRYSSRNTTASRYSSDTARAHCKLGGPPGGC